MEGVSSYFFYYLWRFLFRLFYFLFYVPIMIMYWGKGKSVPPIKNDVLLKSATELAADIRSGKLKSESVVRAYIERIKEVEPYINAIVEHRFEEAIEKAKEVDSLVASGDRSEKQLEEEKPLLGVPFSVKLVVQVKGLPLSSGTALFKDLKASEDAHTVSQLRKAGGIFLATTNAPILCFSAETHNYLYGITRNPYDTHRTPGGSSGGESALLAAAGSVIGLGNDFGGSIRIPAQCTGIFAHKPSKGMSRSVIFPLLTSFKYLLHKWWRQRMVSNEGATNNISLKGQNLLCVGPMTRYPEDLITMMQVLTSENEEKIQFGRPIDFKKLKVFYQVSSMDNKTEPVDEEIQWAIRRAARYFRDSYGILPQEVNIKLLDMSSKIFLSTLLDVIPNVPEEITAGKLKNYSTLVELIKYIMGKSDLNFTIIFNFCMMKCPAIVNERNIPHFRQLLQLLKDEFNQLLDENSVFFYPTAPSSATRHFEMIPLILNGVYTAIFNTVGLPVTQCPLGLNRDGLPQGMQIIGKMNNDPLTLACALELSKAFGGWIPPR